MTINFVFKETILMFQFFVWGNILIIKLTNGTNTKHHSLFTARQIIGINDLEQ